MSDIQQDIIELAEEHAMYSSTLTIEKYERVRGHIDDLTKQLAELEAKLEAAEKKVDNAMLLAAHDAAILQEKPDE